MAEFTNSIDVLGDDAVADSIIDRSIVNLSDNTITVIGASAFAYCSRLTTVDFPACTKISSSAFCNCVKLVRASFPACTSINGVAFQYCSSLATVIFTGSNVVTMTTSHAFINTPMSTTGYFYVPSSMIASYQAATNWAYFSSRFSAVEDYAEWDGTYGPPG